MFAAQKNKNSRMKGKKLGKTPKAPECSFGRMV